MPPLRLPKALCAVVGEALANTASHASLDALFESAGAPGDPPSGPHETKWKEWLFRAGQDENADSLAVLGTVLEEFMDIPPDPETPEFEVWKKKRTRIEVALTESGLRYYRFGRVLPQDEPLEEYSDFRAPPVPNSPAKPKKVEELLEIIIHGLRRAMHPLTHRRKGAQPLRFTNEYDVQDLLHAMLRPWISDIRAEEYTPSYAGSSTRMDFFLPAYSMVIETKIIRDRVHAKAIGNELVIDIEHYRRHPGCKWLWCVIYDPENLITNADGLKNDLEGSRSTQDIEVVVRVFVL